MKEHAYLRWMSENTDTDWCNDSAIFDEIDAALGSGAIGCTSNPPLTYQVLTENPGLFSEELSRLPTDIVGDEKVIELIGIVVRKIAGKLEPIHAKSDGKRGYIRAQVQPDASADYDAMLSMGKTFASWGSNIKVKIPGSAAGMAVLEELAALGIPTNPTVCVTVSQMLAAADAHERGIVRAIKAGITPGHSTSAFVLGRLQDYLTVLNDERNTGLSTYDLECAVLAATKRCYRLFVERGYRQEIMPAAFRCARQVSELAGSKTVMTIHPSIQEKVILADRAGEIRREAAIENPVDPDAVERVVRALPEFVKAYEADGIAAEDFDAFGATAMTLANFNDTGWEKLRGFDIRP
jgi:transaldolase